MFVPDPLLGTVIDGYQLQKALGRGNMARIYRGVRENGAVAAIKVMLPEHLGDHELLARFAREFEGAAGIDHPNVVRTLGTGTTDDGLPYLELEFLEGDTLANLLTDESPLGPSRSIALGVQLAEGLAACHAAGIVHRDLKPENLMVAEGDLKLFDFGLAAPRNAHNPRLTANDMRIGTPGFMAPEYITKGKIDHRSDLYAVGIVLFEMLEGQPPFVGPAYKVMHHHITQPPPPLSSEVPEPLRELIHELLAKAPGDRPASASIVADRLRSL